MLTTYQDAWYTLRTEASRGHWSSFICPCTVWLGDGSEGSGRIFFNLLLVAVLLGAALLTTGVTLNIDLSPRSVLIGTLLGSWAIGFAIGGITLVLKRIDSYTQMVQFLLIALVAAPAGGAVDAASAL